MNTAEVIQFPANTGGQERRVADTEDGFIMLAMELYEELIGANLTKNQAKVAHAICRKTYGFKKKMDRIADCQLAELCRISRSKVNIAKNELIAMKVIISEGNRIGPNKEISQWKIPESTLIGNIVSKTVTKYVTKPGTHDVTKADAHKRYSLKIKENTPPTPQGGDSEVAQKILDYYNATTGSRCSAPAVFEKALTTVKAKGQCYREEEIMLVIRWASTVWKFKPSPGNICRMSRFDSYLSEALIWEGGDGRNPESCPHEQVVSLWNAIVPERAIEPNEWVKTRPAYRNLERVWNLKNNKGNWRTVTQMETIFTLIHQSSLFSKSEEKPWLNLDWILKPEKWASVYEQARAEYKKNKQGMPA